MRSEKEAVEPLNRLECGSKKSSILPCLPVVDTGQEGEGAPGGGRGTERQRRPPSQEPVRGGKMITYGDRTFCMRKGCTKKSCESNLSNVDWSFGLPVCVADFWGKSDKCPKKEPEKMEMREVDDEKS